MWSFISLSIRDNKYITDGLIMPIMFSNSELWYFPHTSKAVNDFKGVIAGWFANLKGCTKEAVKTEKIAKFLFPILVLPKADPVHVAFNKFLTSNSITTSPLTFIKEVINDLPEAFFDGVNNVMEKIAEIGVDNCMEYWETILLWLNNVLMALTNDSAFEYVDTAAEIFWPIVKDIIVLTHERMDKLDKSFLFSIMCNLLEFITNFATKYQTVLEGLILNEKIVCKRCKDSECTIDFYYPDINKLCKCGHKYLTHYKHQRIPHIHTHTHTKYFYYYQIHRLDV